MKSQLSALIRQQAPTAEALRKRQALLAKADPSLILALFEDGLLGISEKELLIAGIEEMTSADPRKAARAIRQLTGGWQQAEAWEAFAKAGAASDPYAALAEAENSLAGSGGWR